MGGPDHLLDACQPAALLTRRNDTTEQDWIGRDFCRLCVLIIAHDTFLSIDARGFARDQQSSGDGASKQGGLEDRMVRDGDFRSQVGVR